jgi:hypothetical protein
MFRNLISGGLGVGLQARHFGKSHLSHMSRRERKWVVNSEYHLKDMTKDEQFKKHLRARKQVYLRQQPVPKISALSAKSPAQVPKRRRKFLNLSPMNNPQAFYKINKHIRTQATAAVEDIRRSEFTNMS